MCKLCFDSAVDCVLSGCGHQSFCLKCVAALRTSDCPICRKPRGPAIRFYRV